LKVELHCHTSRYSACSAYTPEELLTAMVAADYGAVYFTEHARIWPAERIADLQSQFPEILIFPGIELVTPTNPYEHLLVLGTDDIEYAYLADAGLWADALAKARAENHLTILAHPCRFDGGHEMLDRDLIPDAMELWTGNQSQPQMIADTLTLNETFDLPLVHAGDTHGVDMIDRYWINTDEPLRAADDIRDIVLQGAYTCQKR
jgi:hypothetical protein